MPKNKRQAIRDRALYYLDKYAGLSNWQINQMVRADYPGAKVADSVLDMLRKTRVKPVFHPLVVSGNEADILKAEGFTTKEAKRLAGGLQVSLDDPVMVAFRKSRVKWWGDRIRKGWTAGQIRRSIAKLEKTRDFDPWVEFRQEYIPSPRQKTPTQFRTAMAKRRRAVKIPKPMYHLLKHRPRQPVTVTLKGAPTTF